MHEAVPPLHPDIQAVVHMVRMQDHWQLPEFVGASSRAGVQQLRQLRLWAVVLLLVPLYIVLGMHAAWGTMLVASAVLVLGAAGWRWWWLQKDWPLGSPFAVFDDAPLYWRGCVVDVAQRTVHTVGLKRNQAFTVQPGSEWSLAARDFTSVQAHHVPCIRCVVELRHVRRGPVLVLCSMEQPFDYPEHRVQLEQLVDEMAQRLGIRRTGAGLLPPVARGKSAAVRKNQQ